MHQIKVAGFFLGYLCRYLHRYLCENCVDIKFSKGEWNTTYNCRLPLKWNVWSSKPRRDNVQTMVIFSFRSSNSVNPVLTNIGQTANFLFVTYWRLGLLKKEKIKHVHFQHSKKHVPCPSVRGNVKMCNRITNKLLFVESVSIPSNHYSLKVFGR